MLKVGDKVKYRGQVGEVTRIPDEDYKFLLIQTDTNLFMLEGAEILGVTPL